MNEPQRRLGVTVDGARAEALARDAATAAALPDNSIQHPILTFAPHDIVGLVTRMRPFLGQLGTSPSATIPATWTSTRSARARSSSAP